MNPTPARHQTLGEEIANSISHGVGLLAALVATPILVLAAAADGGTASVVGASVFAGSMLLLYAASTLYHALPRNRAKRVFRTLDHGAIFILIAGTYTPFTLGVLRGAWGWSLFGIVWGFALTGVVLKAAGALRYPVLSTSLYLVMGWLAIVAVRPLWLHIPPAGLLLLLGGGLAYTVGVAFYAAHRVRYSHFVWHMCVLAGTSCHFLAVLWYSS
ncbi:MAG: hemolysin D [Gemmatimonadetes bacterium RBG_16_66_8]|nr:MAG: hemolysin D [Gemmatimonadetes bacterium RBG_16_66_8]